MKKQKILLILSLFISISLTCFGQKSQTQKTLDSIIAHAENNSLYRQYVDWSTLKAAMYDLAKEADSVSALKPALDLMLKELNDTHGRVFYNRRYLSYYSEGLKGHLKDLDWDVYGDIQSAQVYPFKAELLPAQIGYVRIVGLPMGDNQKMASDIQNAVCNLVTEGAKKWIIDLRYNGGGNMFPMIEGITALVGNGVVGGTKGVTETESSVWRIENGDFYYDEQTVGLENACKLSSDPKIAVLTSVYTASSGEALAVILKNRPQTRFFGNKTNGKITATDWKQIDNLTAVSISVSYYKDREDKVYDKFVDVDETIEFEPKVTMEKDKGILRAVEWLNEGD